jgi:hypothetical protein
VSHVEDDQFRVNVIPKKIADGENDALTTPVSGTGTVEDPTPSVGGKLSTVQLSEILWEGLNRQRVWEHQEVVFVAHSLDGIVTEENIAMCHLCGGG